MKTKKSYLTILAMSLMLSLGFVTGCENDNPAEEIGESIDEAAKDAKRGIEDATD